MESRLFHLLDAYLENRLTDLESVELCDLLRAAPETRRIFWDYVEQHALIEDILGESRGLDLALAEQNESAVPTANASPVGAGSAQARKGRRFPTWRYSPAALAASLVLAVGWLLWMIPGSRSPDRSHAANPEADNARIIEMAGSVEMVPATGPATPVRLGQRIATGQSIRTGDEESSAVIEYPDRTRLKLGAGTTVTLSESSADGKRVSFTGGSLFADVTNQPSGPMIVTGPQGEVRVSDTQFVLTSVSSESSRLDLAKGKGEMSAAGNPPVVLNAGNVALVSPERSEWIVRPMPVMLDEPRSEVHLQGLQSVAFSTDEKTILASTSYQAVFWDGEGRVETIPIFKNRWAGWRSCWSADGSVLAVGNHKTRQMLLWDAVDRKVRRTIDMPDGVPQEFVVAQQGRWLAALDLKARATQLRVWDGATGTERAIPPVEPTIGAFAASPDGRRLAVGRGDKNTNDKNTLLILDAVTGKTKVTLPVRVKAAAGMGFSDDGRYLAFGHAGQIQIWDVATQSHVRTIRGHERHVRKLVFSPDGKFLAGAMQEGPVWVWRMEDGGEQAILNVAAPGAQALTFAPNSRSLATVHAKGQVLQLWDIPTGN